MAVTHTPVVVPHRWDFVFLLFGMGVFGFIAQTLLTMGLQRETAGRGTLAVYIQVCSPSHPLSKHPPPRSNTRSESLFLITGD